MSAVKGSWDSRLDISAILVHIGLLLAEPNPDDALMNQIVSIALGKAVLCIHENLEMCK